MTKVSRFPAVFAYLIPVIGWLYVFFFQRKNDLAVFHLRQSLGLFLYLVGSFVAWALAATIVAFIPYMASLGMALFTLVIAAYMYGVVAWIMGMSNAVNNRLDPLPLFGRWANRLPIH